MIQNTHRVDRRQRQMCIRDRRWKEDSTGYALMVPEQYAQLQQLGLPMQEVDRDSRRVIVKHPDSPQSLQQ